MTKHAAYPGEDYSFNLGVPYISAALKLIGFEVYTFNPNIEDVPLKEGLQQQIEKYDIDAVGTGDLSTNFNLVKDIVESVKEIDSKVVTIVGGNLVSADPIVAMEALEYADYGVIGEGEVTICELCCYLEKKQYGTTRELCFDERVTEYVNGSKDIRNFHKIIKQFDSISEIAGIVYRSDVKYIQTSTRNVVKKLDIIPWPDYKGFGFFQNTASTISTAVAIHASHPLTILSSRSCPFKCTFCFHPDGNNYRTRSLSDFLSEIDYMLKQYPFDFIHILDDLFLSNVERVSKFCDLIEGYDLQWSAAAHITNISDAMVSILKNSKVHSIMLGVESLDDRVLKSMRKKITAARIKNTLEKLYNNDIPIVASVILGDIEETEESASNSIKFVKDHPEYSLRLGMIIPLPGTYIYRYAINERIIKDAHEYLRIGCPPVNFSRLSDESYKKIAQETIFPIGSNLESRLKFVKSELSTNLNKINIVSQCSACSNQFSNENLSAMALNFVQCPECGTGYQFLPPLPKTFENDFDNNITKLFDEGNRNLVIWGINSTICDFINMHPLLREENCYLTDYSPSFVGMELVRKTVVSNNIIDEKKIEVVIVSANNNFASIRSIISRNYPSVKYTVKASSLLLPYDTLLEKYYIFRNSSKARK